MTTKAERKAYLDEFVASKDFGSLEVAMASSANMRTRPEYTRRSYESKRPGERIPNGDSQQELHEIMRLCSTVYDRVGIVKSFTDILAEFAIGGLEIVHPDPVANKFYGAWQAKVKLKDRASQFATWAIKGGNVVARRQFAKMKASDVASIRRSADLDTIVPDSSLNTNVVGRVPIKYTFYDPSTVDLVGEAFAVFANNKQYALRVPLTNYMTLTHPKNNLEKKVWDSMPQDIKDGIEGNRVQGYYYIPIPEELVYVASYKKDDTQMWAKPIIYSVLDDVFYNDKLKLAKTAALDGMINCTRLWTVGDHTIQKPIYPNGAQMAKLSNILANSVGGGGTTILWDSAIKYQEFYPPIEQLVNFEENIDAILLGLGVPKSLIGGMEEGSSKVNMMSFKGLLRKIEVLRAMLVEFIQNEINLIQEAMGFRKEPFIQFAQADLYDDQVWYDLVIKLLDRNLISDERVLELIKENPELEKLRVKREEEGRNAGIIPPKASTLHNPMLESQQKHELKRTKIQAESRNMSAVKPTGNLKKGRPVGKKDAKPRSRTSKADVMAQCERIYDRVEEYVSARMLEYWGITDMRKLSAKQKLEVDEAVSWLFVNTSPDSDASDEALAASYVKAEGPNSEYTEVLGEALASLKPEEITQSRKKILRSIAYTEAWTNHYDSIS